MRLFSISLREECPLALNRLNIALIDFVSGGRTASITFNLTYSFSAKFVTTLASAEINATALSTISVSINLQAGAQEDSTLNVVVSLS
jgi:hypothetical protein